MHTIRFFSPLKVFCDPDTDTAYELSDGYTDADGCAPISYHAVNLESEIQDAIGADELLYGENNPRGLMKFFRDDPAVAAKVFSAHPMVQSWNGKLWGVMTVKAHRPLTKRETKILTDYFCGQYSDGWGEGFEQRPIDTPHGDIYASFWQSSSDYSIREECDLKHIAPPDYIHPVEFSIVVKAVGSSSEFGFLDLPANSSEIMDALDRAGARNGQPYIVEVREVRRDFLTNYLPISLALSELNLLAERLSALQDGAEASCYEGMVRLEPMLPDVARLINLTHNLSAFRVVEVGDPELLAQIRLENNAAIPGIAEIPEEVWSFLDYSKLSEYIREAENGVFVGDYYITRLPDAAQITVYTGTCPPADYDERNVFSVMAENTLTKKTLALRLPMTDDEMWAAKDILHDGNTPQGLRFTELECEVPQAVPLITGRGYLEQINQLAHAIAETRDTGMLPKLKAALEFADCKSIAECGILVQMLDRFDFLPNAVSAAEYGAREFERLHGLTQDASGMDYFNFDAFGRAQMRLNHAKITPYGIIIPPCPEQELSERLNAESVQNVPALESGM